MFGMNKEYVVIKNGIHTNMFSFNRDFRNEIREEFGMIESDFLVGNVGRIHGQKNQDFLIDVMRMAKIQIPDAKLLFVGPFQSEALYEQLKLKIEEYGLGSSVIFAGERNDIHKFYSAFDVFALPSRFEGFSVVGVEAQTAGLPCLFSDSITPDMDIRKKGCRFLPITEKGIADWVDALVDIHDDEDMTKLRNESESSVAMMNAGYDVNVEAQRVSKLLQGYLELDK